MKKEQLKACKELAKAARQRRDANRDMAGAERESGRSIRDQLMAMKKAGVAGRQAARSDINMAKGMRDEAKAAGMKKGGRVKKKIDGCATKGKTKGRMV